MLRTYIAAAFGLALSALPLAAQDAITLPAGAQLVPVPEGACGLQGIVVLADGSQEVLTLEGEVRPVGEADVVCLTQLVSNG
ncbi:hypothetical protein [Pseudoroseicyclus sp. CXY001]|uniref:hypothetical protein n=1 Tax=Pseudoroseicyclus sp. CXY001 TaxID=3242492 RepID=UPI00358DB6D8